MGTKNNGGPAFPGQFDGSNEMLEEWEGMSLRDYFAAQVVPTLMTGESETTGADEACKLVAAVAYRMADAMLVERAK